MQYIILFFDPINYPIKPTFIIFIIFYAKLHVYLAKPNEQQEYLNIFLQSDHLQFYLYIEAFLLLSLYVYLII